jgi:hypothetical protein
LLKGKTPDVLLFIETVGARNNVKVFNEINHIFMGAVENCIIRIKLKIESDLTFRLEKDIINSKYI